MSTSTEKAPYLTKDITKRAVGKGIQQASREAMDTAGSLLEVEGDWIVRRYKDGRIVQAQKLQGKVSPEVLKQRVARLYE
jgi:hypothetical protein